MLEYCLLNHGFDSFFAGMQPVIGRVVDTLKKKAADVLAA
jgi:hypothetical protein